MKSIVLVFLLITFNLEIFSQDIDSGNDIYMYGSGKGGVEPMVTYWKNGVAVNLTDGAQNNGAIATGLSIVENDVYVSGYSDIKGTQVAKYWKNGKEVILTDGKKNAKASSIYVVKK
ncbi:MAG: hypothetical protein ACKVOQ_01925 [Cyclobacteriaceae bacterium]